MYTPWGASQGSFNYATGVVSHSTSRHGGIHLSDNRIAQMSADVLDYMKRRSFLHDVRWYEEDCDWVLPILLFENDVRAHLAMSPIDERRAGGDIEDIFRTARRIAQMYHRDFLLLIGDSNAEIDTMHAYRAF